MFPSVQGVGLGASRSSESHSPLCLWYRVWGLGQVGSGQTLGKAAGGGRALREAEGSQWESGGGSERVRGECGWVGVWLGVVDLFGHEPCCHTHDDAPLAMDGRAHDGRFGPTRARVNTFNALLINPLHPFPDLLLHPPH